MNREKIMENKMNESKGINSKVKKRFLSEMEFRDLSFEIQMNKIKNLKEKEKFQDNLPYAVDRVVFANYSQQINNVTAIVKRIEFSFLIALALSYRYTKYRYYGSFSYYRYLLKIPVFSFLAFLIYLPSLLISPEFQYQNRIDFMTMSENEFMHKKLQEKCDLYDSMDAILDLRERYSQYEINQLKKEHNERNNNIVAENMEYFYKFSNNKV